MKRTPGYFAWANMKQRCLNKDHPRYPDWGGRGIEVCEDWLTFKGFLKDMGPKPSPEYSIERIDNDGNYERGNCKWATKSEQNLNQRLRKDNSLGQRGISYTGSSYRVNLHRDGIKYTSMSIKSLGDAIELRDHLLEELKLV